MSGNGALRWLRRGVAVTVVCLVAALAFADRDAAEFFHERGTDALRKRDYGEAVVQFNKALAEDAAFHAARLGLAEALLEDDRRAEGLVELRRFVDALRRSEDARREWSSEFRKGERLLARVDARGTELTKRIEEHVGDLLKFARKWESKDPEIAIRALRQVLELRPGHADAVEKIESLGASPKGEAIPLFNGENLDGFTEMAFPTWQVRDGLLVGDLKDGAVLGRTEELFEGDFDVIMEARIEREHPGPSLYAMAPCSDGLDGRYSLGVLNGRVFWEESIDTESERDPEYSQPRSFDKDGWNTFELRLRGGEAIALVNGEQIGVDARPERRGQGFVGLLVQNAIFQVRKLVLVPR